MTKTVVACAAACVLFFAVLTSIAHAVDGDRLIWMPSKTGDNSYRLKMGAKFDGTWDASAGGEFAVSATKAGKMQAAPSADLWGLFSRKTGAGTARTVSEDVDLRFNAVNGAGNAGVARTHRWIVNRHVDFETRRSLALQCNAYESHCGSARLSQETRIASVGTGTALVAQTTLESGRFHGLERVGVEQDFGKLRLGAALTNPTSTPRRVFSARYALNW